MSVSRGMRNDRAQMGDAGSAATSEHEVSATGGKRKPIANCEYLMCPMRHGEPAVKRE